MTRHARIIVLAVLMAGCNNAPTPRVDDQRPTPEAKAATSTPELQNAKATTPAGPVQAKNDTPKLDDILGDWVTSGLSLKIERGGKGSYVWLFGDGETFAEPVGELTIQVKEGRILIGIKPIVFGEQHEYEFVAKLSPDKTALELEETNGRSKPKTLKKNLSASPENPEKKQSPSGKPSAKDEDVKAREEKLRSALKLCGKHYYEFATVYEAGKRQESQADVVWDIGREILFEKGGRPTGDLAERFPLAAKKIAEKAPNGKFQVRVMPGEGGPLKLKNLQELLGKEDSTEKDTLPGEPDALGFPRKLPVTWYCYGWCCFGVYDTFGHVLAVRAECKGIK